jgi:hypothetical protein
MTSAEYHTQQACELRDIAVEAWERRDYLNANRFMALADLRWAIVRCLDAGASPVTGYVREAA